RADRGRRDDEDRPPGGPVPRRELADRRRLPDAVHADDEDDVRGGTDLLGLRPGRAEQRADLLAKGVAKSREIALRGPRPLDRLEEPLGRANAEVAREERLLEPLAELAPDVPALEDGAEASGERAPRPREPGAKAVDRGRRGTRLLGFETRRRARRPRATDQRGRETGDDDESPCGAPEEE